MAHSTTGAECSNADELFILVLTVLSLIVMVLLLPFSQATIQLLTVYDNLICVLFLIDFFLNLLPGTHQERVFLRAPRLVGSAWLDSLVWLFQIERTPPSGTAQPPRANHSPDARPAKTQLVEDIVRNRGQYVAFVTVMLTPYSAHRDEDTGASI
jgi:hypothetical protein